MTNKPMTQFKDMEFSNWERLNTHVQSLEKELETLKARMVEYEEEIENLKTVIVKQ